MRIGLPLSFGLKRLAPLLLEFAELQPAVSLEMDYTDRRSDLVAEGVDLAIRITARLAPGDVARRLGSSRLLVVASPAYLARHERARYWADFEDFALWRLDVLDLYFVGGFAAMDWITAADYRAAVPDPLADAAAGIIEHMNRDHADALVEYARHFAHEAADEATMVSVDRLGFKLRLRQGERLSSVRIAFPAEVRTATQSRETLIAMLGQARASRS